MDEFVLIVTGFCAAVWTKEAISVFIETRTIDKLNLFSAVTWTILFIARMIKYVSSHKKCD